MAKPCLLGRFDSAPPVGSAKCGMQSPTPAGIGEIRLGADLLPPGGEKVTNYNCLFRIREGARGLLGGAGGARWGARRAHEFRSSSCRTEPAPAAPRRRIGVGRAPSPDARCCGATLGTRSRRGQGERTSTDRSLRPPEPRQQSILRHDVALREWVVMTPSRGPSPGRSEA